MDLCQALVEWAPQAAEPLPALLAALDVSPPCLMQFSAGLYSLSAVATMAGRLGVQPSAAFRIASACQLVFDLGRRCTAIIAASAEAGAAAGRPSSSATLGMLTSLVAMQLEAVGGCFQLLQPQAYPQTQAAVAFVRSTARPDVLVGWLREVARAMAVLRRELEESTDPGGQEAIETMFAISMLLPLDALWDCSIQPARSRRPNLAALPPVLLQVPPSSAATQPSLLSWQCLRITRTTSQQLQPMQPCRMLSSAACSAAAYRTY